MATITHAFVNGHPDGADATLTQPSNWNAAHVINVGADGLLVQQDAGAGGLDGILPNFYALPRLSRTNATTLALGAGILPQKVSGVWKPRFSASVTVGTGGLAASTVYWVYAVDTAGVRSIECSTTTHATDATIGVETKSGDATRTLVGMIRTNASTQYVDTAIERGVISYYNRKTLSVASVNGTGLHTLTNGALAELATAYRCYYLTWGDEMVMGMVMLEAGSTVAGLTSVFSAQVSGDGVALGGAASVTTIQQANFTFPATSGGVALPAEGSHYLTIFAALAGAGTASVADRAAMLVGTFRG